MPDVAVVITDLDNTLYDWVATWHQSFAPMLDALVAQSGVARAVLEREIRAVHQQYGTSEYVFVIQELPSLQRLHPGQDLTSIYREIIDAYWQGGSPQLYPGVWATLATLKQAGCVIVAYTESRAMYAETHVARLGLDGVLDWLYTAPDHSLPHDAQTQPWFYPVMSTRHLIMRETKPNPHALIEILETLGAHPAHTVYIGDSLIKDVAMAQAAGVIDVYASYGAAQQRAAYQLLRRVTHWTDAAVQRERKMLRPALPTYRLEHSFAELLDLFAFTRHPILSQGETR